MKKLVKCAIVTGVLLAAQFANAQPVLNNHSGYVSQLMQHSQTTAKQTASLYVPTDITVINAIPNQNLYVVVPGTSIYDRLAPESAPDHIMNRNGAYDTMIELRDAYNNAYFSQVVCPHAVIVVYGHQLYIDTAYCN